MKFVSLFAGIGGFDLWLERAGAAAATQVEINEQCRSVLARQFPGVPQHDDVNTFHATDAVRPDLICGGFPCQDLSVAGRRAGLAGDRSGLFYEFMRIVAESTPRWVCLENVPGLLSSNGGRDMGAVLGTLGQLGYGYAYRVFDAQFFGVPQRRRRVFIVGCLGDVRRAAEVLFERDCLPWDSPPSREARQNPAGTLTSSAADRRGGGQEPGHLVANGITCRYAKDTDSDATDTMIAHTLRAEDFDASEDGTGRGTPLIPCHAIAFQTRIARNGRGQPKEITDALTSADGGMHADSKPHVTGAFGVRRLMPIECERLQGFPDNWTALGHDGKAMSDSARYRMLGNAVCVNVAEWIGRRILSCV